MKSQLITPEIKKALWRWYQEEKLTQQQIAEMIGIKNQSVNAWLNGQSKIIRPKNWVALYPHLKPYLAPDFPEQSTSDDASSLLQINGTLSDLYKIWPKLSLSEQGKVLSFAAELLEK